MGYLGKKNKLCLQLMCIKQFNFYDKRYFAGRINRHVHISGIEYSVLVCFMISD